MKKNKTPNVATKADLQNLRRQLETEWINREMCQTRIFNLIRQHEISPERHLLSTELEDLTEQLCIDLGLEKQWPLTTTELEKLTLRWARTRPEFLKRSARKVKPTEDEPDEPKRRRPPSAPIRKLCVHYLHHEKDMTPEETFSFIDSFIRDVLENNALDTSLNIFDIQNEVESWVSNAKKRTGSRNVR